MVVLATPERAAMPSIVVPSLPSSRSRSRAASMIRSRERSFRASMGPVSHRTLRYVPVSERRRLALGQGGSQRVGVARLDPPAARPQLGGGLVVERGGRLVEAPLVGPPGVLQ